MNICVTGVSGGLGNMLVQELVRRGHMVWGCARSPEKLEALKRELPEGRFRWSVVDVSNGASLEKWVLDLKDAAFIPDCMVLNASIQLDDMAASYDHAQGEKVLKTNLDGSLRCVALLLPLFLERKRGSFVAIGSTVSLRPSVRSAAYAAGKAGLTMAFRAFALRYAKEGVRFQTVVLGPIATDMWEGKRNALVPGADQAARAMADFLQSDRQTLYYPFLTTTLLRLSLFLPDRVFQAVSSRVLK